MERESTVAVPKHEVIHMAAGVDVDESLCEKVLGIDWTGTGVFFLVDPGGSLSDNVSCKLCLKAMRQL